MQFRLPFTQVPATGDTVVVVAGHPIRAAFVRHRRARHYILRVTADGALRVTMPWRGSRAEAERFVVARHAWIERERYARSLEAGRHGPWTPGTAISLRGAEVTLEVTPIDGRRVQVTFGECAIIVPGDAATNLRPHVERHLRRVAERDLPDRLRVLAAGHGLQVVGVTVRAQRSRWGSCSPSGRISLNWRLIQLPPHVSDYVLLHELAHLRHLNHSTRFWREVDRLCPSHREARAWLRGNARLHAFGI
jgi:hypothetical protein